MLESTDLAEVWKIVLAQIEVKIESGAQFKTWFQNTTLLSIEGKIAYIGVANAYAMGWIRSHHHNMVKDTLSYVYGQEVKPEYKIDMNLVNLPLEKTPPTTKEKKEEVNIFTPKVSEKENIHIAKKASLNEFYSFTNYVVGSSNKLAHAAASGVADHPGVSYNPLFIYGESGLGKTHLAQAVARRILEADPTMKTLYVSSEKFLNDMVSAIRSGKNMQFRQKYRTLDLLIIDDIQFIHKWKETQNEFFHTFNVLHNANKQIILVSDRPPEEIQNLESRLRSRFQGGMVVDVARPDFEMRLAILEKKSRQMGSDIPVYCLEILAEKIMDNIRELEGALQKVALFNNMQDRDLSREEILNIIGKDTKTNQKKVKVPQVIKHVAQNLNVTVKDLKGPRRTKDVAFARQICMYLLREDYGYKLEDVARFLQRKDHTTVIHAVDKIKSKVITDDGFKTQIEMIRQDINSLDS